MLLYCQHCAAMVNAEFKTRYHRGDPDEGITERISFLSCPSCWGPFVVSQEDFGGAESDPVVLFPTPTVANRNFPKSIQAAYSEADACFRSRAFTAAAIMCRKTLEGLCSEHNIKGKVLVKGLGELRDRGVIENRLFEWAEELRISGNEAAHDVNVTVSAEDARDLIEFTHALLEYVFTFQEKFALYRARRAKRSGAEPGGEPGLSPGAASET